MRVLGWSYACFALVGCFEPTRNNLGSGESTGGTASPESGTSTEPVASSESTASSTASESTDGANTTTEATGGDSGGPTCGNGTVDGGEACDDGINDGSYGGCSPDCTAHGPHCGDGRVHRSAGEACDDGDEVDGNGCNIDCIESGAMLWTETYSSNIRVSDDHAADVDIDDDGTLLVVGTSDYESNGLPAAGLLLWYDSDGVLLDDRTANEAYARVSFGGPGYVILQNEGANDHAVAAFDATSALQWTRPIDATALSAIAVDQEGSVYVAGFDVALPGYDTVRAKLDSDGDILWDVRISADSEGCFDVDLLPDEGALFACDTTRWVDADGTMTAELEQNLDEIVTRSDGTFAGLNDAGAFGFDNAGAQEWHAPVGASRDIAIDGAGNVVVVGGQGIAKFTAGGAEMWTATHDANATGVAVAPDDAIVVVGDYDGVTSDVWVRKYAP